MVTTTDGKNAKNKNYFPGQKEAVFSILYFLNLQLFQTYSLLHISDCFSLSFHLSTSESQREQKSDNLNLLSVPLSTYLHPNPRFAGFSLPVKNERRAPALL